MRGLSFVLVVLASLVASVIVYLATGGAFVFFFLPLLLGLPLLGRGRGRPRPLK